MTSPSLYVWQDDLYVFTTSQSTPSSMSYKQALCRYNAESDKWSATYYLGFSGATNRYQMSTVFTDANRINIDHNILFSTLVTSPSGYIYLTMYDGFGVVDTLWAPSGIARTSSNVAIENINQTLYLFFKRYTPSSPTYTDLYSLTMDRNGNWATSVTNVTELNGQRTLYTPHSILVNDILYIVTVSV